MISSNIRDLRKKAGMSQEQLAEAAFHVRKRGIGNAVVLDGVSETPEAAALIELAGFKSELSVGC